MTQTIENAIEQQALISKTLERIWGFRSLRPLQQEVVEASLANRDAVVVMPTGGGKSLCFQLPAVVSESLTVVVSPLIALMKDQVDALRVVGVKAAALNSSMSASEEAETHLQLANGEIQLLYISPERLLLADTFRLLSLADRGRGVARFAIDEAHCISAWGHDFRPEFRQLGRLKQSFPGVPIQAFTATATPKVQRDIAIQLKLERPRLFVGTFDRPNLTYRIVAKDDAIKRTVEAVNRYPNEGVIVYCLSRKDTEGVAEALVAQGVRAVAYHAGLPNETRKKISEDFAAERANIIVATTAFGMGIDRSNVRCVIHECLPKSMEGYQQETGRAGRDGMPSECVLLYSNADAVRLKRLLVTPDVAMTEHHVKLLEEVRRFATSHQCRHKTLSEHFGQAFEVPEGGCGACDVCLGGFQPLKNSHQIGQQILQSTLELEERARGKTFGVQFLVSVLMGSRVKQVVDRGGEAASCFGVFRAEQKDRVTAWIHQMVDLGLLEISDGQYPTVSVTENGRTVLAENSPISLVENVAMLTPAKLKTAPIEGYDEGLYEKLRAWRRDEATARSVPAYVIFHDATLMRISAARPSTVAGLRGLAGVGDKRAEEYGVALVRIVAEHAGEMGIGLDQALEPTPVVESEPSRLTLDKYGPLFRDGLSVEEVGARMEVKAGTVYGHLNDWVKAERPESIEVWVSLETQEAVAKALKKVGTTLMKPVYEELGEEVPYDVIRLVRTFLSLGAGSSI